MNAFMNIQVRIITARAQQQIRALEAEIRRLDKDMSRGSAGARGMEGGFARAMTAGTKFGNQLQWTGRQLQYNFSMPIALATGLAVKFALENEAAMVRVQKVYGDAGQDVEDFGGEVKALERNFRALSNHFGVHRAEVIKIAGDWAAAGATGIALAKATRLTLETMVLGEMGAAEATEALLAVQGQYNLSVQELSQSMDTLNMIENETDVSMKQLITSMARSAGTARQAGVDIQHLAAMTAALVPEAGAASNAGNGLKTIISRMLAPTEDAAAVLGRMGLSMEDLDWQSLNVTQRLQKLADEFVKLPEGQRAVVGEYVAGRYQITRFNQALTDIADRNGDYHKAVSASADATQNYRQRVRELNAVLGSNPQKMKQVKVILENTLADVIVPLLPAIVFLAQKIAQLAQAFANLDPSVQMIIGSVLLFLMLFGPLIRYIGSSITLFATLGDGIKYLFKPLNILRRLFGLGATAAAASAGAQASATAAGAAAQTSTLAAAGGRMSRIWAATHGAMFRIAKAGWLGQAAAQTAYTGFSAGQNTSFFMSQTAQTGAHQTKMGAMWSAFWAKRNAQTAAAYTTQQAQAAGAISAETSAWVMGYTARTQAAASALALENNIRVGYYTKTASTEVALRTTLQGLWAQYWMQHIAETVARGQQWVVLQLEMGAEGAAAQQRTARLYAFIWRAAWTEMILQAVAAKNAWVVPQLEAGKVVTGSALATTNTLKMTWFTFWAQWILGAVAANQRWVVLELEAGAAVTSARLATVSTLTVMTEEAYAAMAAMHYGMNSAILAGEQAFGTRLISQRTVMQTALTAGTASSSAAQVAIRETALAHEATAEATQQTARRARFAGFWTWMSAGHQAWMLRMAALGQVGFSRMGWTESAALTASRARWSAYWIQLSVMQKGAAAKMVATDAAMKGRMAAMRLLPLAPWVLLFAAIIGAAYVFRDEIVQLFQKVRDWIAQSMGPLAGFFHKLTNKIVEAFYRLPKGVQNAMLAVVRLVHDAAMKVYELFSYLNPFARHSPSLVENVTAGSAIVAKQYQRMGNSVANSLAAARRHLAAFKSAAAGLGIDEWSDKRMEIAEGLPQMLPLFNQLVASVKDLSAVLAAQATGVAAQEAVVKKWKGALDNANAAVDAHQMKLDGLRTTLQTLEDAYASHEAAMQSYASAPIKGMGEMSDKIFENELAQKKLRLEIMDWEDANGSIDEVRDRLAMLQGDIETARGEAADLRSAGAGSDILGPIEAEIAAMEAQAKATTSAINNSPVNQMQKDLAALERAGTRLDLENAIQFDPLLREIDKLANGMEELPFDTIIAGINREKAAMDALTPQIEAATEAVKRQEAALDSANAARDNVQATYDLESAKLDALQAEYSETESLIRDIESALNDVGASARDINEKARAAAREAKGPDVGYAVEKFDMSAAADFADVGGSGNVPREFPEIGDQSAMIDEMTKQLSLDTAKMFGEFDMLGPIKRAWGRVTEWWSTSAWPALDPVLGELGRKIRAGWETMFDGKGFELPDLWSRVQENFREGGEKVRGALKFAADIGGAVWRLFGEDLKDTIRNAWDSIKKSFGDIGREVEKFGELWEPLKTTLRILWDFIKGVFVVGFAIITLAWKLGWSVIAEVVGPIIDVISDTIENGLQIIRGIFQTIMALINGDWKLFAEGLWNIAQGIVDGIWDIFKGAVRIIWGVIKGLVEGIYGFFKWLWDELVGHSIIPDTVNGIVKAFQGLAFIGKWINDNVIKPIVKFFKDHQTEIGTILTAIGTVIWAPFKAAIAIAKFVWDNVLKPLGKAFVDILNGDLGSAMKNIGTAIWAPFKAAIAIAGWVNDNVIKPVAVKFAELWVNHLRPTLNTLLRGIGNIWNAVGEGVAAGVNIAISAINKLIEAINWVGKNVPGLNFSVSPVGKVVWTKWTPPQFETGGVLPSRVGEGFATSKARAIVGEGKGNHPEYVIPTDPKYRANALKLYGDLGAQLGNEPVGGWGFDIPKVDLGKVASTVAGAASSAAGAVRRGAVTVGMAPFLKAFDTANKMTPNKPLPMQDVLNKMKNDVYNWAKGVDNQLPTTPPPGVVGSAPLPGAGWSAIENWLRANGNVSRTITSTFRSGDTGYHGSGRAVDYSGPHRNGGYNDAALRNIFNALLPVAGNLSELILAGAPFNIKNGRQVPGYAWGQPGQPGNHWNHVHAAIGQTAAAKASTKGGIQEFAKGGIVHGAVQGVMGEAGTELITPLTPLWARLDRIEAQTSQQSTSRGDTIININGDLVMPNITDGSDAESFIRNLEIMARR